MIIRDTDGRGIGDGVLYEALKQSLQGKELKRVLLLPPDYTRMYSGAGKLTGMYYSLLKDRCEVDILPALGTHVPMTEEECKVFFGEEVPFERVIVHNWRKDVVKIGEVPAEFVSEVSDGLVNDKIDVEVNKLIVSGNYDLIISMGQVVPHEVVGMANYSKNIFVGCGGSSMINSSHMLGAFYGMERIMGKDFSPVRRVFDYAEENFIAHVPLLYVLTVTTNEGDETLIHGIYIGRKRELFEAAVAQSRQENLTFVDKPFKKVVVNLDPREFKSTWLGNKAVYRTRMAIADGGELIVLAPGVKMFGEDEANDVLIRKYGYVGREKVLELVKEHEDLKENLSVAAHLIHGSSDGRFSITYCTKLVSKEEVEGVAFNYLPYDEAVKKYDPEVLKDGYNTLPDGEEIFYISNPALGLWDRKGK
jgi:nickel-dependent lactate racemase